MKMIEIGDDDVEQITAEVNPEFPNDVVMRPPYITRNMSKKTEKTGLTLQGYGKRCTSCLFAHVVVHAEARAPCWHEDITMGNRCHPPSKIQKHV